MERSATADGKSGLRIIDVSNPSVLGEVGHYLPRDGDVRGVDVAGRFAYLASGRPGLVVVDISDPKNPLSRRRSYRDLLTFGLLKRVRGSWLFGENEKVLLWQVVELPLQFKPGLFHLSFDHLTGGVMAPKEFEPLLAAEIDDRDATVATEVFARVGEVGWTVFEVVVGIGCENDVYAGLGQ